MSYFTEVEDFKTYQDKEEDFHFIYNGNTGGGQSFLGGKYRDEGGNLASPIALNGRIGVFRFKVGDRNGQHDVLIEDDSVSYEIKPRAEGDSNMKLSVGDKPTPSVMIATFLMLPKPCGIKRTSDINTSVLNGNNFWLQSMWLSVDTSIAGKAILTPRDCVICGGIDKLGQGAARYFRINFEKRISDIIRAADANELEGDVQVCIKHFADIYKGVKPFVYDESAEVIKRVMKCLSSRYPEKYSGTLDPLSVIKELVRLSASNQIAGTVQADILAAIRTKPFILLAGISGTGKSRLVRQLAKGCCKADSELAHGNEPGNFASIAVRPNWHDSTELIGYVSRLGAKPRYVITDFVRFLAKAWLYENTPFFLCLDEMNLAPVEQYFAEYLSVVESRSRNGENKIESDVLIKWTDDEIRKGALEELFGEDASPNVTLLKAKIDADKGLRLPPNLIVMGTVNMDETTFSFSRKVLDRAMSFELNEVDMDAGLQQCNDVEYGSILADSAKASLIKGCEAHAAEQALCDKVKSYLIAINERLEGTSFKIAYRTRDEMMIYCIERIRGGLVGLVQALDEATSMKILSRIEGDTDRITEAKLTSFRNLIVSELLKVDGKAGSDAEVVEFLGDAEKVKASACCTKLNQMIKTVHDGAGFVSFWQC